jgi:enamine deaminase RidA (YjgF/YER057c/UK114 family)
MSEAIVHVDPTVPLTQVLQLMVSLKMRSFPAMTADDRKLVGTISRDGVMRALKETTARTQQEITMKRLIMMLVCGALGLLATSTDLLAQTATGAEARLTEMNIALPPVPAPVANYVDSVRAGNLLFLAGNTAGVDWKFKGKVGKDITVQEGYETARQVGLIMLAKVRAALGSLDRVKRVVKVLGMVNSPEGFGDQPRVVNGFSDLMVEVFGEQVGKHARSAVGMQALPSNSAVEVEMIVEVE